MTVWGVSISVLPQGTETWVLLKVNSTTFFIRITVLSCSKVKILTVEKKINEILNRLEKTKVERFPDLAAEKEAHDREERNEKKAQIQEMKRKEKEEMKKKKELEELRWVRKWAPFLLSLEWAAMEGLIELINTDSIHRFGCSTGHGRVLF